MTAGNIKTIVLSLLAILAWGVSSAYATVINVSTSGQLTTALSTAVAGDEIVLADGIYSGQFTITTNSGTASQPIIMRATNLHQAILEAPGSTCSWAEGNSGILLNKNYWKIQNIKMRNQVWGIYLSGSSATNNTIENMIIDNYRGSALMLANGANNNLVQNNVIGLGDPSCVGTPETDGIQNWKSANNTFKNNIILPNGDNGYACASGGCSGTGVMGGYGMLLTDDDFGGGANTHDNMAQGNLIIGGGRGVFRILNGVRTMVRDNGFLWGGGGGMTTDHCSDDYNTFINNIVYGNHFLSIATKGNDTGTRGNHVWRHNLIVTTPFSRDSASTAANVDTCGGAKFAMTLKDNLIMSESALMGGTSKLLTTANLHSTQFPGTSANYNLFWAPSTESTWQYGYTYGAKDIHSGASQPVFVNATSGDFTLATGSPGRLAASDCQDIGIAYNTYLKKPWFQNAFALPVQEVNTSGTSVAITVDPSHTYQIWFYIPSSPCALSPETFTVEGAARQRDIVGLTSGEWIQAGSLARWVTLGMAKATDGTLNISWTNSGCTSKMFIRQLPTADEAYTWIVE